MNPYLYYCPQLFKYRTCKCGRHIYVYIYKQAYVVYMYICIYIRFIFLCVSHNLTMYMQLLCNSTWKYLITSLTTLKLYGTSNVLLPSDYFRDSRK